MALGNNLKKIKKDSLIPIKKKDKKKGKEKGKAKLRAEAKPKNKVKAVSKVKPKAKATTKIAAKAKLVVTKPKVSAKAKSVSVKVKEVVKTTPQKKEIIKVIEEKKPTMVANLDEKVLIGGKEDSTLTIKLIPSRRKTVRKTKAIIEGSLSLLEADAIKDCLITIFNDYDLIDFELKNITHLDLIPIQLIKAFISYYPDKKVKVDSELPFDIKIIAERAGFGSLMFKEDAA